MQHVGVLSDADGKFTLSGLVAGKQHDFFIIHEERRLGAKVTVAPPKDSKPVALEVKLQLTGSVAGRVLDEDKKPMPETSVVLYMNFRISDYQGMSTSVGAPAATDQEGRFTIHGLVPGGQYNVQISPRKGYTGAWGTQFEAKSGETHQVPDSIIYQADQSIAGVVVDPSGKPLAGVQVNVWPNRPNVNIDQNAIQTDKEGRFRFANLPKGTIQLNAYRQPEPQSSGPVTVRSTSLRVEAGKQDIRMILVVPPARGADVAPGKPAPEFPVSTWLNRQDAPGGAGFTPAGFRDKVVLLAFLDEAKPSQRLLPRLNQLHEQLANKGFFIVRVHETTQAGDLAELSPTMAALVAPGLIPGGYSEAFQKYAVRATPTLFLIDRQGTLRQVDLELEALQEQVEELLKR
jgi:hypothetical protein